MSAPGPTAVPERCEVAVVGGGPAGSAAACLLSRAGRQVVLLEKEAFPRDKLCGEFLSTESRGLLERIGCWEALEARGPARITKSRFFPPSGPPAAFDLPGEAWGVSRRALDEVLFQHARAAGAAAIEEARVTGITPSDLGATVRFEHGGPGTARNLEAALVIGAFGRSSPLHPERSVRVEESRFVGLKRHHRPLGTPAGRRLALELAQSVEIHLFDGGYCGLSFIEGGFVNVCMLLEARFLKGVPAADWESVRRALSSASPSLGTRLGALSPCPEATLAVAHVSFAPKGAASGPVLFIGDAAAMIPPLCGDGQAMALRSAVLLAERLSKTPGLHAVAQQWREDWETEFGSRLRLGRRIQSLLLNPRTCGPALRTVGFFPGLADYLVRSTRG
ncbi:MAG: FAD-dependent monooxygenase [Elusimicrobia bacterium]|nr:FAD-dependent monooxygenase [Elusimicrobiota bacterium]